MYIPNSQDIMLVAYTCLGREIMLDLAGCLKVSRSFIAGCAISCRPCHFKAKSGHVLGLVSDHLIKGFFSAPSLGVVARNFACCSSAAFTKIEASAYRPHSSWQISQWTVVEKMQPSYYLRLIV